MSTDAIDIEHNQRALAVQTPPIEPMLALVERAARDQTIDVEKMEKLLVMAERLQARKAEAEYDLAMNLAQSEMRPVANDSDNPQTRSRYVSYGALDRAVRPIYTQHGFSLSFGTKSPSPDRVTVTCRISHRAGHTERVEIDMPADGKGAKGGDVMTKTHATGSAVSYGMRYLLKMIFNIAVGEYDDDGNAAGRNANRSVQGQPPTQRGTPPKKTPPRGNGGAKQGLPDALKRFDERCKAKLVAQAKDSPFADSWRRYAIDKGWILPNEDLDAIMGNFTQVFTLDPTKTSEENGPAVQAQFLAHERAVKELALGPATKTDAPQPELPAVEETSKPNPDWVDACPNCEHNTVIMSPAFDGIMFCKACAWQWDMATGDYYEEHDWEKAVCPIPPKGTLKKDYEPQTLGQIARLEPKRFYGLVMNNQEAKGWTGRDGKHHEPSQADLDFAEACQAAVLHMEQSKQQDADPEAYD